tara:strand:+ start:68 stop:1213 length:1146 start_codon:yes stop_codon:yes gene_type:complete
MLTPFAQTGPSGQTTVNQNSDPKFTFEAPVVNDLKTRITPSSPSRKELDGQILRYPFEALTQETDYLQIDIRQYESVAARTEGSLVSRGRSIRRNAPFNENAASGSPFVSLTDGRVDSLQEAKKKSKIISGQGSIILPIPSNIQDSNSVSFSSGNLDGVTAQVFGEIQKNIDLAGTAFTGDASTFKQEALGILAKSVGGSIVSVLRNEAFQSALQADLQAQAANMIMGGSLTRDAVFARTRGEILNQNVELLFNGVTIRSFKFSFKLTPRGPKEAQQVGLIINTFKKNMSAKIPQNNDFLGTPNVFELTYKKGPNAHPFLHTFKQCVLTDMSVNYTGEGTYATYAGTLGAPVSMILELGFKELEPIYNLDYDDTQLPGVGY